MCCHAWRSPSISQLMIYWQYLQQFLSILSNLLNCIIPTRGESNLKAWKLWAGVAAVLSGDLGSWILEIVQLPCCDLCSAPPLAVDKALAAADELRAYFSGYFVFACRITKATSSESRGLRAWEWKLCRGKTDGDEMVKFLGTALGNFWCALLLLLNADINCLPGSAASGRSSCNNTAVTELWRVYDPVPAVKWGGLLKAMWVKPDYTMQCVSKN